MNDDNSNNNNTATARDFANGDEAKTRREWVDIKDISVRPDWQVRDHAMGRLISEYRTHFIHGATMPPIRLANVDGALVLIDGYHRLEAQKLNGATTVEALIEARDDDAAQWEAAIANTRNGKRLKRSEVFKIFRLYMRQGRYKKGVSGLGVKSYREIARDMGGAISKSAASNWMREFYPAIARKMSNDTAAPNSGAGPWNKNPTPAQRANEAFDLALAELRAVKSKAEREELLRAFAEKLGNSATGQPWTPKEENNDF